MNVLANYFVERTKTIIQRYTNCGCWDMCENIEEIEMVRRAVAK